MSREQILRFHESERHVHWALAIPFMVCYSTALVLVTVYNPNPNLPLRLVVSWIHRISGTCLFALPTWTLLRHWRDAEIHVHNVRQVWRWTRDDVKWLSLIGPASICKKIALPHQGKFNAGEKLNFMSVSATYSIYILTGLGIWLGVAPSLCWLVHFSMAACATPLLFGHVMMATVNPDTRPGLTGMISGFVDREWAHHHYHNWFEEHYGSHRRHGRPAEAAPAPPAAHAPASPAPAALLPAEAADVWRIGARVPQAVPRSLRVAAAVAIAMEKTEKGRRLFDMATTVRVPVSDGVPDVPVAP